jgi:hypothetical protein
VVHSRLSYLLGIAIANLFQCKKYIYMTSFPPNWVRGIFSNLICKSDMTPYFNNMWDVHEFLILFIPTLSLLLKKHVHLTCSRDTCHFYRLGWRRFLQPSLEENSILILIKNLNPQTWRTAKLEYLKASKFETPYIYK